MRPYYQAAGRTLSKKTLDRPAGPIAEAAHCRIRFGRGPEARRPPYVGSLAELFNFSDRKKMNWERETSLFVVRISIAAFVKVHHCCITIRRTPKKNRI